MAVTAPAPPGPGAGIGRSLKPGQAATGDLNDHQTAGSGGLGANVVWMLAGTVWQGFCQWVLLVVLAKLGNVDMVGIFTLALAIGLPFLMFSSLSLRSIQITDHRRSYRFVEYLTLRVLMVSMALVVILSIALAAHYSRDVVASIVLITAAKAAEYTSDVFYGLLQREERMAGVGRSMILRGTLSVMALGLGVYFTRSLVCGAIGLLVASAATLLAYDVPTCLAQANTRFSAGLEQCAQYAGALLRRGAHRRLGALFYAGLPLGAVLMLASLNLNVPRYFIERSLGLRELGIFAALANVVAVGSVIVGALGQGVTPRLAKCFARGEMPAFWALLGKLALTSLGLGAAGLTGAVLFGRETLATIYRPEYSSEQDILVWLMAASGFIYLGTTIGCAVTAVRCFTPQLPLLAIAVAATAVACMILVPAQGLRGAAVAILISAVIQSAGSGLLLHSVCKRTGWAAAEAGCASRF